MPTTITLSRATTLLVDNDNDSVIDPGDIIRTILHLVNVGAQDALNLSVSDNFTGSTLVPGSIKITPIAFDDSYTGVTGNTPITYSAAQGVLANDVDPDGAGGNAGLSVTKINGVAIGGNMSITGGTVNMASDGSFTFTPTTGFNGTATFNYTIQDAQGLNNVTTGTVNIQVNGGMIWYVDNAFGGGGNDGSYLHPFTSLASLNGVGNNGATTGDPDGTGDTIFVYHNGGAYSGGLTLEAGEKLYGDGQSLLVNGHNIGGTERTGGVDNVATNPTINVADGATGIVLSTDNEVKGLDLAGQGTGSKLITDGNGAVSTGLNQLAISNVGLTGQGQLIDIDQGGKASISLNSLSSTGSTGSNGGVVDLTGLTTGSSFTVTGTTSITGTHSQAGMDISGNSGITVSLQGNVTINTGAQNAFVLDTNTGTDSVTFGGSANTFTTTTGNAVEMTGNTTATTVNLTNGGLGIHSTTGTGLNVGATTINIAGANNTIDTTSGPILVASNAAVGASGVTFATLTSTLATTGNAIDINNLDNGNFTVSGNVTIANTGAGFDGVHIVGGSSTNFAFNGTTAINGTGSGGDGVELNGANGTVSFNTLNISGVTGTGNGLSIQGATNTVTVTGGAIATGTNTGDAVNINGGNNAISIGASVSKNVAGDLAEVNGHTAGTVTFSGAINASGTASGINLVNNSGGTITFTNSAVNLSTGTNNALNFTNTAGTGANVSFTGGNLNIHTTSGTGINATTTTTNAGTLTISGANNSVTATTGRAINVDGVTSDLTFHDVSKNGGSTTAIFLRNTDGAAHNQGQFVITGTGTTGASGGTIANIDDAGSDANGATANQTGSGIEMTNVSNVSLSNMTFGSNTLGQDTIANLGIHGEGVNNFTLKNTNFLGKFGDNQSTGPDEDAIRFGTQNASTNGLTGTGSFLGDNIQFGAKDNLAIFNGGSGSLNFTFTDLDAGHQAVMGHNQAGGNTGIQIQTGGTAGGQGGGFNLTASITNTQFDGNRGDAIFIEALQHTTQNITVTGNSFVDTQTDKGGGFANVNGGSAAGTNYLVTFNISNNTMTGAVTTPIVGVYNGQNGNISGIIANNTIGNPNGVTDNSGSSQGNGIFVAVDRGANTAGTLIYAVRIDSNNIADLFQASGGIAIRANNGGGNGTATIEATVQNNHVQELGSQALAALFLQLGGGAPPDNGVLGIDLKNNVFTATGNQLAVVDIDQVTTAGGAHLNVPNYPAASPTSGQSAANALSSFWTTTNGNSFTTGGAAFSAYGPNLAGVTHNAFTHAVPLMAVVPPVVPWEDDPSIHPQIVVTSDQDTQPPVTITPTPDPTPGTDGQTLSDGSSGGTATDSTTTPTVVDDGVLTQSELNLIVAAAIQRWSEAGLTADQLAEMHAVSVTVSDMMGLYVGSSSAGQIFLDSDAAGYGWFIDATPNDDVEFEGSGTRLTADAGGPADHKIDLLTVVMHELGHQIGLGDIYASAGFADLMYGYVNPGERRLPATGEADGAVPGSQTQTDYAIGPITNVTDLPAGKGVDIIFDSTVNSFSNQVIPVFHNQATVSGTNLTVSPINSNTEDLVIDTLTLGNKIFLDVNANGIFDAGDTGITGVTLTLYADSNGNGVLDGAELTNVLATTTTDGSGNYSFTGLAPGDYVVSIDASNFTGGGALVNRVLTSGGTDPDNNIDNDSNGIAGPGGTVISAPIRLDYNQEPTPGTGNDTNNTLDIGFLNPNHAPSFTGLDGTPSFTEGGAAVVLDNNATVSDPELSAAGNYAGASLTLARSGGAVAEDLFGTSGSLSFGAPNNVLIGATVVGTFTQSGGTLVITFNSNATGALVNSTLQQLTYTNTSDNPPTSAVIGYDFSDGNTGGAQGSGGVLHGTGSVTVSITPVDDPSVANNDSASTPEDATVIINVVANDSDPDTPPPAVAKVNGTAISVGSPVTLPSGAIVSLNLDGTLTYDPNHQFDTLTSTASGEIGAVNTSAPDSFTYTLGGSPQPTATVNVTVNGVVSPQDQLKGDAGDNTITGTPSGDFFDLSQGGNDTANGLGGNDAFYFAAAFTAADTVDGGGGTNDQIGLQGDYTGANKLIMGASTMTNVETLVVLPGFSYDITMNDGNVAAGGLLKVQAQQLAAGQSLHFDGTAEHDGAFFIFGGQGNDSLTGGDQNDAFYFGPGAFTSGDLVNGGPGTDDQLGLDGNYGLFGPAFVLGGNITNVETIVLLPGPAGSPDAYNLTTTDSLVPAGATLEIYAVQVTTNVTFDGSNEHDGAFKFFGGSGSDNFTGSSGDDWIFGGGGADLLTGGLGNDTFYYDDASQSTSLGHDKVFGFDETADKIDLPFTVTGFATPASGALSTGSFDSDLANAFSGLTSHQAGMFTATSGDLAGHTFLVIDADGVQGYQAGSDYVIEIVNPVTAVDNPAIFV